MTPSALKNEQLPGVRWAILRTIGVGGHLGATEVMCREVVIAEYLGATRDDIRTQFHYLEERKLLNVERSEIDPWRATLTRYGHDVLEYQVDVAPGIRRPPRLDG